MMEKGSYMRWISRFTGKSAENRSMTEQQWEAKLKIDTMGRLDAHADEYHHPYEPTPYSVLVRLAESGYLRRKNHLVDYGCGKGRVGIFLHHAVGCRVTGIEYNEPIYRQAVENQKRSGVNEGVSFICANAESYPIGQEDCFYFFNPFSIEIFRSVIGEIITSYYRNPRKLRLFFYYPNDDYISYLMTAYELMFLDEIDCRDLFEGQDPRERILIFEIGSYE